jgi:hypothetical protein
VNFDPRFLYIDCVGGNFERVLKMHRKAKSWSEKDTRALTDGLYRDSILQRMIRAGLARLAPNEREERATMITEVVNLLGENGKRELAFELIKKRKTIEAADPTDPTAGHKASPTPAKSSTPPPRRVAPRRSTLTNKKQWDPILKEYVQQPMSARKIRAGESNDTIITIIDTFSGTGGTVESAREVTMKTAIPTKVLMTCEIDKGMRESTMRRLNVPCHDDMRAIVDTKMPIASIL